MRDGGQAAARPPRPGVAADDPPDHRQRSAKGAVELRVLGPLETLVDGRPVPLGGPKQRAVLGVLLAHDGGPVPVGRMIDELWGDAPPATATAALQVHVSGLRKVLPDRIRTVAAGYRLDLDGVVRDTDGIEGELARARAADPAGASTALAAVLARWRGPAYGGVPASPAVAAAASRWSELRLGALEDRVAADLTLGRHAELTAELAGLTAEHPTRERLAAHRMLAAYRCGRPADALAAYRSLRKALADELGVEPGAAVEALAWAVERGDPTLAAPGPAGLPVPASRFVGRRRELEQVGQLLGRNRVVTVTGPGGCGKTRLTVQLARDAGPEHPDGVVLVELAGTDSVAGAVAAALGVREQPEEPLPVTLTGALRHRRVLLVLDNCEHVLAAVAELAGTLLARCPGLRVLASSRERLGVEGEAVWALSGLALPADDSPAAAGSDAVRLLVDRAALARPGFRLAAADVPVAAALCRRLDGLPLAIELAAARLRAQSLAEVAGRLDRRLDLLAGGKAGPARHRTLRATLEWGHQLLEPDEQVLFRRLGVFAGGWTPAGAAAVLGDAADVDVLTRLVDRSLVVAEPGPDGTRYRMLETVREYAAEQLAAAGEEGRRRDHAQWCRSMAERVTGFGGDGHSAELARLAAEHANVLAALDWAAGADPELGLRIAAPMWWFWWERGLMASGRDHLARALAAAGPAPTAARAGALRAAAALARISGDLDEALRLAGESLATFRAVRDPAGEAAALNSLLATAHAQGDFAAALEHGRAALVLAEAGGDGRRIAATRNNLGNTLRNLGRRAEAAAALAEAREEFRAAGDRRGEAAAASNLAIVARQSGDPVGSRRWWAQALALYRELDLVEGMLDALEGVACLLAAEGRAAAALRLLTVAERERQRLGAPLIVADELADRDAALAAARAELGPAAGAVAEAAATEPFATVVNSVAVELPG